MSNDYTEQSTYCDIISSNILRTILTGPGYLRTYMELMYMYNV